jgi:transcriptional regulator with XRE-family HTH domain
LKNSIPQDYSTRIKVVRQKLGLTQARLAELMGVSFASVNRWENGQARPNALAWRKIERVEVMGYSALREFPIAEGLPEVTAGTATSNISKYFLAGPLPVETEHSESSLFTTIKNGARSPVLGINAFLTQDAGVEKMFMAGLYIREMLIRGLIQRILIIAPENQLIAWEQTLSSQFGLSFQILASVDANEGNPFKKRDSNFIIASLEMLGDDAVFALLREPGVTPYDVAILDDPLEAPPTNGSRRQSNCTGRHQVAEAFTGVRVKDKRWRLPWQARHLLLLSARMNKNYID